MKPLNALAANRLAASLAAAVLIVMPLAATAQPDPAPQPDEAYTSQLLATQVASAVAQYRMGEYDRAADRLIELLMSDTTPASLKLDGRLYLILADAANRSGRPEMADRAARIATVLGAPAGAAAYQRGVSAVQTERFEVAADYLEAALLAGSRESGLAYHLAVAYGKLGRRAELIAMNQRVEALRALQKMREATHLADVLDTANMLPTFDQMVRVKPASPTPATEAASAEPVAQH